MGDMLVAWWLALAEALRVDLSTADRRLANAAQQPWVRYPFG